MRPPINTPHPEAATHNTQALQKLACGGINYINVSAKLASTAEYAYWIPPFQEAVPIWKLLPRWSGRRVVQLRGKAALWKLNVMSNWICEFVCAVASSIRNICSCRATTRKEDWVMNKLCKVLEYVPFDSSEELKTNTHSRQALSDPTSPPPRFLFCKGVVITQI